MTDPLVEWHEAIAAQPALELLRFELDAGARPRFQFRCAGWVGIVFVDDDTIWLDAREQDAPQRKRVRTFLRTSNPTVLMKTIVAWLQHEAAS